MVSFFGIEADNFFNVYILLLILYIYSGPILIEESSDRNQLLFR